MADYKTHPANPPATTTTTTDDPPPAFGEIQPLPQSPPHAVNSEKPPIAPEPQPQPQPQVYINTVPIQSLARTPSPILCPICGARGLTVVSYETGNTTHLAALLLCFVACLGCIPYLFSAFKDIAHSCGNCGTMLAIWHRSGTPGAVEVLVHPMGSGPQVPVAGGVKQS